VNNSNWDWVAGSSHTNPQGFYSDKGNAGEPMGREGGVGWYDSFAQEFWLFGGMGEDGECT